MVQYVVKEYEIRNKQTGEIWELDKNQVLVGMATGIPAIVTDYYYSKPQYIDLNVWEIKDVNDVIGAD